MTEWSFSLYDESLDIFDTYSDGEECETSHESTVDPKPVVNQYNPFIISKMNYFKRKQTKVNKKLYTKAVKINTKKMMQKITTSTSSTLNWESHDHWIQRRGFPSEILIDSFRQKVGTKKYKLTNSRDHEGWYIIGYN
ncbi:hypothetical protein SBY92_001882 [Candida maltosa Xu316]|uniref:Uncharacterized protein n=1 Tax=Candida maltosa (strain Xu316) TaxID=1245528 RepID=M3JFX1_CANMX|nr:hypothetical protein G210_5710 [Candida maltosa Xu316]